MASLDSKESPSSNPGLQVEADEATKGYFLQQTVRSFRLPRIIILTLMILKKGSGLNKLNNVNGMLVDLSQVLLRVIV